MFRCDAVVEKQSPSRSTYVPVVGAVVLPCRRCGHNFEHARGNGSRRFPRYCSADCARAANQENKNFNARIAISEGRRLKPFVCVVCAQPGKTNNPGRTRVHKGECSAELQRRITLSYVAAKAGPKPKCVACGDEFTPSKPSASQRRAGHVQRFCSRLCYRGRSDDPSRKPSEGPRQRPKNESVDPIAILERGGWFCYLCYRDTPKHLRGTTGDAAPEIDHVIPISAGGLDTEDNMACACRRCNRRKGAMLLGEYLAGLAQGRFHAEGEGASCIQADEETTSGSGDGSVRWDVRKLDS